MAISLPSQSATTVVPEYAATNISFNRQIQNISGVLTPVFTVNISYERKDYIVNDLGVKIGLVTLDTPINEQPSSLDPRRGGISLALNETMALFAKIPETGKALGEVIADEADALIHADLVARGIISA